MTKINVLNYIISFGVMVSFNISCSNSEPKNEEPAKVAQDSITKVDTTQWTGIYQGTVPGNNSISLNMTLNLLPSNTYELNVIHLHKNPENNLEKFYKGNIEWSDDSTTIALKEIDSISNKFRLRPGIVEYLNPDATPNTGKLSEFYYLQKK